jgi:hypothetical protein
MGLVALATVVVGREVSPQWQLGVLALVLGAGIFVEAVLEPARR